MQKKKIVALLTDKINQIELAVGHEHGLHVQCDILDAYFNKWEIRRIRGRDLWGPVPNVRRRRFTTLVRIENVWCEIPSELFKKALVLGSFP
jgi:hypothetical protein